MLTPSSYPVEDHAHALLAALAGFVIGGLAVELLSETAKAVAAGMTLGTFLGGVSALARGRAASLSHDAAIGGVLGGLGGLVLLLFDLVVGG